MNLAIFIERVSQRAKELGYKSERSICLDAGVGADFLRNIRTGKSRSPSHEKVNALAKHLGVSSAWLAGEDEDGREMPQPPAAPMVTDSVPEIDVRAGLGGGGEALLRYDPETEYQQDAVAGNWMMPPEYLRNEVGVPLRAARIISVVGDSMSPTLESGDRVMVNTADKIPSPPGLFAIWDGFGVVVKRLEVVPNSDPTTVRLISDNVRHTTYERTAEEVSIVGRVVWLARRL